ncbi:MAG: DNA-binding protein, partial [Roseburia sp.]|nr:DNA-binding protein [Roseburia sp.]
MKNVISTNGTMTLHSVRLHRGDDFLLAIKALAKEKHIKAGVVLSAVGCVLEAKLRDASGVTIRAVKEHCEIVSLNGT